LKIAGVDGCRAGWLMIKFANDEYTFDVYPDFQKLIRFNPDLDRIFIDIPIGLSTKKIKRTIDSTLRRVLKKRGSTVFNAPSRPAVYEINDEKARALNIQIEGKSLSIQSLNIRNKIKEVDEFLIHSATFRSKIYESHPEFCFSVLNGDILLSKKSTKEGIKARLEIIKSKNPVLHRLYNQILHQTKRNEVKKDDIVDAICLCICNQIALMKGIKLLKDENTEDIEHIPIRIAYFE
jgi:8-oxo-dGTP diphosphatase